MMVMRVVTVNSLIREDINIFDGFVGLILIIKFLVLINEEYIICGSSNHPWSISFIDKWANL